MVPGTVLADRYRLISLLGRGGMGEVWRAEHLGLRAPVAVKLMARDVATNQEALGRFNREAQSAAALRSPHVVQILDHGVDPASGMAFIAMELMEGETLSHRIARIGALTPADTARVVTHIARALSRAHEAGIVHRDLKPDNVFLVRNEDEEIAKVLDFGIAKVSTLGLASDVATRTGAIMGTPYYMSPEQIGGSKHVDQRTDLWALGVIAWECLLGRRPFDADNIGGLVLAICTAPLSSPSSFGSVPLGFDLWAARALERDPSRRFQSARELADSLRAALGGAAPAAHGSHPQQWVATGAPAGPAPVDAVTGSVAATAHTAPGTLGAPNVPQRSLAPLWATLVAFGVLGGGVGWWKLRTPADSPPAEPSTATAAPSVTAEPGRTAPPPPPVAPPPPVVSVAPSLAVAPVVSTSASAAAPPAPPSPKAPRAPARAPAKAPAAAPAKPPAPAAPAPAKPPADSSSIFDRRKG